jgi:hypothetical protein
MGGALGRLYGARWSSKRSLEGIGHRIRRTMQFHHEEQAMVVLA